MSGQALMWSSLKVFWRLCDGLPHETALSLGSGLGGMVRLASGSRALRARRRCERILGVDEAESARIISGVYSNFGRSLAEFLRLPRMLERLEELIAVEGEEHLRRAFALGRGVIFLSAHIGNWEYGAALLARRGLPVNAIGAEQRDVRMTAAIEDLRRSAGVRPIGKGLDLRGAIACLRSGEILALLLDQDARESGVISPFLGHPASTPTGPLRLARKFGAPVLPVSVIREPDGVRFKMTIEPPLEGRDGAPFGDDLEFAAGRCNDAISAWIRRAPDQWLWLYPRWATTLGDR
jgi:KDO2-lipid IV(A) lauroyltransferase